MNYQYARVLSTINKIWHELFANKPGFFCNLSRVPSTYEVVHGDLKQSGTRLTYNSSNDLHITLITTWVSIVMFSFSLYNFHF